MRNLRNLSFVLSLVNNVRMTPISVITASLFFFLNWGHTWWYSELSPGSVLRGGTWETICSVKVSCVQSKSPNPCTATCPFLFPWLYLSFYLWPSGGKGPSVAGVQAQSLSFSGLRAKRWISPFWKTALWLLESQALFIPFTCSTSLFSFPIQHMWFLFLSFMVVFTNTFFPSPLWRNLELFIPLIVDFFSC